MVEIMDVRGQKSDIRGQKTSVVMHRRGTEYAEFGPNFRKNFLLGASAPQRCVFFPASTSNVEPRTRTSNSPQRADQVIDGFTFHLHPGLLGIGTHVCRQNYLVILCQRAVIGFVAIHIQSGPGKAVAFQRLE